jgi:glycosyltransferase involved in cell wall biosynthesis
MLSILIPTYNYDVCALVRDLQRQCAMAAISYEIVVLDDGSTSYRAENRAVNEWPGCRYEELGRNIGRSAVRNLLARRATFNWVLFLDADVLPANDRFVARYLASIPNEDRVIGGGLLYAEDQPEKNKMLRWVYGRKRESVSTGKRAEKPYQSLLASNFLTTKSVMARVPFNEDIPDLRREDTLFSFDLMRHQIPVSHIDNPVYHMGLDDFETALLKENESLDGLKYLLEKRLLPEDYIKISRLYATIGKFGLKPLCRWFYTMVRPLIVKNLQGGKPSLALFDLYRIGYLCHSRPQSQTERS